MSISLGLVGCGAFGRAFIRPFQRHPDVHRFALCDLSDELLGRAATEHQVGETYSSLDEICRSDLDALVIITQHWMHAPQAICAMEAGKHVYTAVPCAWTLEECDALVQTARRTGQIYMNGETSYFRPEAHYCRTRARAGEFGHLAHIECEYLHDMDHGLYEVYQRRMGARFDPAQTGERPMKYPTHSLCFPVCITGSHITSVSCVGFELPGDAWFHGGCDGNRQSDQVALYEMACGTTVQHLEFRRVGHPGAERVSRVFGTEASFEWTVGGRWWCTKHGVEPVEMDQDFEPLPEPLASDKGGHGGSHSYLVHEFVDSCNRRRLPRVNVWEAARYCAPGLVACESAKRGGERLPVPDWGDAPG